MKQLEPILRAVRYLVAHKFLLITILFAIALLIDGNNSIIKRIGYQKQISKLSREIEQRRARLEHTEELLEELDTRSDAVERVARELYFMQDKGEDVYVER